MKWIRLFGARCGVLALILSMIMPGWVVVHGQADVQVVVRPDQLNVRAQPGFDAATIGYYARGTVLHISGWDGTVWIFTTPPSGDLTGWVHWDYVDFPDGFDVGTLPIITATGTAGTASEPPPNANPAPAAGQLSGSTVSEVNLRSGPGTTYSILQTLPVATPLILAGRNADATWVKVQAGNQSGWLFAQFVAASGAVGSLPEVGANPDAAAGSNAAAPSANTSTLGIIPDGVIPTTMSAQTREIFLRGQELGNRADVFVKVGDSISEAPRFLTTIGLGMYDLGAYQSLSATIDYFSQTTLRTGNPFLNQSVAVHGGWTSYDLITPAPQFLANICGEEIPLLCEYRLSRPAVALIMVGTNDSTFGLEAIHYRNNLERIVYLSIYSGVIPVLSTIPDNPADEKANALVHEYNNVIHQVAAEFGLPLWNYGLAMLNLPHQGMSGDGIHPNYSIIASEYSTAKFTPEFLQYGYNMRNFTALLTLEAVWRGAMY